METSELASERPRNRMRAALCMAGGLPLRVYETPEPSPFSREYPEMPLYKPYLERQQGLQDADKRLCKAEEELEYRLLLAVEDQVLGKERAVALAVFEELGVQALIRMACRLHRMKDRKLRRVEDPLARVAHPQKIIGLFGAAPPRARAEAPVKRAGLLYGPSPERDIAAHDHCPVFLLEEPAVSLLGPRIGPERALYKHSSGNRVCPRVCKEPAYCRHIAPAKHGVVIYKGDDLSARTSEALIGRRCGPLL